MPIVGGTSDNEPRIIWNNAGRRRFLGVQTFCSDPAPSVFLRRAMMRTAETFFVQGLIFDPGSAAPIPASLTNGILLRPVFGD